MPVGDIIFVLQPAPEGSFGLRAYAGVFLSPAPAGCWTENISEEAVQQRQEDPAQLPKPQRQ